MESGYKLGITDYFKNNDENIKVEYNKNHKSNSSKKDIQQK